MNRSSVASTPGLLTVLPRAVEPLFFQVLAALGLPVGFLVLVTEYLVPKVVFLAILASAAALAGAATRARMADGRSSWGALAQWWIVTVILAAELVLFAVAFVVS